MSDLKNKKVALIYDRVNKWGGAERVLLALHELFPQAPLYTAVYNSQKASWANIFQVNTSFLQNFPFASAHHEYLPLFMPLAFESFSFDEYDLVISVTSEAAKGIITKPDTKHICYCLTPTRYLWSGHKDYFSSRLFRTLATPAILYLKKWDLIASKRPDKYIAISGEVQGRIKKYYGRESEVVYPPRGISSIKYQVSSIKQEQNKGFFLIVSRLVAYKRIDLAIKACNELKLPLIIIGKGSEERKLRKMAGPTIEFLGNVTDKELAAYYASCKALLFPGNEDFGLAMVEAQSFGKPVIAYNRGGALEIVKENKTGILFNSQTTDSLINAMVKFDSKTFKKEDCIEASEKFSAKEFKINFTKIVESLL